MVVIGSDLVNEQPDFRVFYVCFYDVEQVSIMGEENALAVDSGYGRVDNPHQGVAVGTAVQRPIGSNIGY